MSVIISCVVVLDEDDDVEVDDGVVVVVVVATVGACNCLNVLLKESLTDEKLLTKDENAAADG